MNCSLKIASFRETVRWCSLSEPRVLGFRSGILRPPGPFLDEPLGFAIDHGHACVSSVVADLCARRRRELLRLATPETGETLGRVLITTAVSESLVDGTASDASAGWFDSNDLPPWDTWFAYGRLNTRPFTEREVLFAFVPRAWQAAAERGMRVNPVNCIEWATDDDLRALESTLPSL